MFFVDGLAHNHMNFGIFCLAQQVMPWDIQNMNCL